LRATAPRRARRCCWRRPSSASRHPDDGRWWCAAGSSSRPGAARARAGNLLSDSIRNRRIEIVVGAQRRLLAPSDAAGCIDGDIALSGAEVARMARDGAIGFEAKPDRASAAPVRGVATVVPQDAVIVVTDIDDTIKDTNVKNHAEARANTLLRPFRPVEGMPALYRAWQAAGGSRVHFHVVSAGPWQLYEPLRRFSEEAGFPPFTWDMRCVDATDPQAIIEETIKADPSRLLEFKLQTIRAMLTRWPDPHVVLVGDSGERDPETYARILAEYPDRVDAVYIRDVTGQGPQDARYRALYPDAASAARLKVFVTPDELPRRLGADHGVRP
jgi:phosphatidate phosphatase APP1